MLQAPAGGKERQGVESPFGGTLAHTPEGLNLSLGLGSRAHEEEVAAAAWNSER
jgi:hypothetical protein